MIPYILLALYTLLMWYFLRHRVFGRKCFLALCLIPAALLLGLRGGSVGEDTAMYLHMAEVSQMLPWQRLNPLGSALIWNADAYGYGSSVDPGWLLYCKAIMTVFDNPQAVLLITSILTCALIGIFLERNTEDVGPAYWFFLCGGLYMFAFNGVRQMLALAIAANFYQLARKNRWVWAAIIILLASLIHRSALVMLAYMAMMLIMRFKRAYGISVVVAILLPPIVQIAFPLVQRISGQYASYYAVNYWNASYGGVVLVWAVIVACAIVLGRNRRSAKQDGFLSFCALSYVSLEFTASAISIIERVALYPLALVCLSYPEAIKYVRAKNHWWFSLITCLILFALYASYSLSPARSYVLCF